MHQILLLNFGNLQIQQLMINISLELFIMVNPLKWHGVMKIQKYIKK